jgi:histidinol dehydrogenase
VGINLFPDRKLCSFDCPYCEVFPFETDMAFKLETMKTALRSAVLDAQAQHIPVRDICFSGNGEPTMSPDFTKALEAAAFIRNELVSAAKLVVITNGSGLLDQTMFEFLRDAASSPQTALEIWLKLDAGTEAWYQTMDRSDIPFAELVARIREFAAVAPFIIQTMICKVNGKLPPQEENAAWVSLVTELAACGPAAAFRGPGEGGAAVGPQAVQIYGKARPAPEDPLAQAVPAALLEERAERIRSIRGNPIPAAVYE